MTSPVPELRPLRPEDAEAAARVQLAAFRPLDVAEGRSLPPDEELLVRVVARMEHLQRTDPEGCWVADLDGGVVGVALSLRRGDVWFLSLLVVDPARQSAGTGARLLDAALRSAEGTRAQYLCSSSDPRALRRYGRAGFALHPGWEARGRLDRSRLRAPVGVREGDWDRDGERLEALVRDARGAGYGPDLEVLRGAGRLLLAEGGAAVHRPGSLLQLTARDESVAEQLLWAALGESGEEFEVEPVLPSEQWAVQVLLEAGVPLHPGGGVGVRGMPPPRLHLPSGAYG